MNTQQPALEGFSHPRRSTAKAWQPVLPVIGEDEVAWGMSDGEIHDAVVRTLLAEQRPLQRYRIAAIAGLAHPDVREALEAMVASGKVTHNTADETYQLVRGEVMAEQKSGIRLAVDEWLAQNCSSFELRGGFGLFLASHLARECVEGVLAPLASVPHPERMAIAAEVEALILRAEEVAP